jgi:hypothetical protein
MNESLLYRKLEPWFKQGGLPIRIENAIGSGMPDILVLRKGRAIFVELKIQHSGKIHMPKFQWSFGRRIMRYYDASLHWVCVWDGTIKACTFSQVALAPNTAANDVVTVDVSRVEFRSLKTKHELEVLLDGR